MRYALLVAGAVLLSACARSAPDLPPDYGSVSSQAKLSADQFTAEDLRLTCKGISAERETITAEAGRLTGVIKGNRQHNQVAGYLGGLFLFPLIAAKENPDEKRRLDAIQGRWDTLIALQRFKTCST
ncbi:MAG: hypothetical protein HOL07_05110 [Rhodospirillaceae bacterium]|jgi:hypothetical protein|nr:hypothetical protein [Rhodospirillaceae bacterium]MBT3809848.1 hypothetical protein [Rhodospirillaceae bacterium]MBT3929397.1 hypothetical protein [Rhodospirillaceae bacterium]MBT4771083.1 hypothetical protein [Rhodospirillaceae bacterium]MBT5357708.1 hypothetical protein [Rhodospirillaceae bacterium]